MMHRDKFSNLEGVGSFIKELLEYNSAGGNKTRGLMTVNAYQMIEKPGNITEKSLKKARILGWYVELLQTAALLLDDIIDNSSTRRGSPCWYRLQHVGLRAINDSTVLYGLLFDNMRTNFSSEPWYPYLFDYINEAMLQFSMGQHLDYMSLRNYDQFTMKHYNTIATTKMSYYTFKAPTYCALLLANKPHKDAFKNIEDVVTDMGALIMMQNDYMDCFGDVAISGKIGTDIQEGKCTWFAVAALQRCNAAQRAEFEASYGCDDEASFQRVKRLYNELQLPSLYRDVERAAYENIVARLQALPVENVVPPAVLQKLLDMMYFMRCQPERRLMSENI